LDIVFIRVLPWPALSPDLTPIEHLWDKLGRRVRHRQNQPETLQELRDPLVHEWNNIPQAFIQRLIGSTILIFLKEINLYAKIYTSQQPKRYKGLMLNMFYIEKCRLQHL
jgi:transposase